MKVRLYNAEDYPVIAEWWKFFKWVPVKQEALSTVGIVVEAEDEPICAAWVYTTNSSLGWLEWVVVNPKATKAIRGVALDFLIDTAKQTALALGVKQLFMTTRGEAFLRRLTRHGFKVTDDRMKNLLWIGGEDDGVGTSI